jgi:protein SCO1/2
MKYRLLILVGVAAIAAVVWGTRGPSQAAEVLAAGPARTATPVQNGLPFYNDATFTPSWSPEGAHRVLPYHLVDQRGRPFSQLDLDGHITVVGFFYAACHGICPRTVENLAPLEARFSSDPRVRIVTHSVTGDSVQQLARYGRINHVDPRRWRLVTGDTRTIDAALKDSYFSYPTGDVLAGRESMHTENLLLVDGQRRIRGIYRGTLRLDVERLMTDIGTLEREEALAAH